jgi:ribosomal subunit interface protein
MQVTITARRGEIPAGLRDRADAVVGRLAKLAHRPTSAQVTFDVAHQRATAEIILKAARGAVHVASADAPDHRTALDRAGQKLRRQLDKREPNRRRRAAAAAGRGSA